MNATLICCQCQMGHRDFSAMQALLLPTAHTQYWKTHTYRHSVLCWETLLEQTNSEAALLAGAQAWAVMKSPLTAAETNILQSFFCCFLFFLVCVCFLSAEQVGRLRTQCKKPHTFGSSLDTSDSDFLLFSLAKFQFPNIFRHALHRFLCSNYSNVPSVWQFDQCNIIILHSGQNQRALRTCTSRSL